MRKIEQAMIAAIKAGKNWSLDNTRVTVATREDGAKITSVYLHGNLIAQTGKAGGWGFCLAGWNSVTSRSRINAILREVAPGYGVSNRAGAPYLVRNAKPVCLFAERYTFDWQFFDINGKPEGMQTKV